MNSNKNNFPPLKGLRLLFFGPYPLPFGGIASHLKTLMPSLLKAGAEDIAVISFKGTYQDDGSEIVVLIE